MCIVHYISLHQQVMDSIYPHDHMIMGLREGCCYNTISCTTSCTSKFVVFWLCLHEMRPARGFSMRGSLNSNESTRDDSYRRVAAGVPQGHRFYCRLHGLPCANGSLGPDDQRSATMSSREPVFCIHMSPTTPLQFNPVLLNLSILSQRPCFLFTSAESLASQYDTL